MGVTSEEDAKSMDVLADFKRRSKALEFALTRLIVYKNAEDYLILEELKKQIDTAIYLEEQGR